MESLDADRSETVERPEPVEPDTATRTGLSGADEQSLFWNELDPQSLPFIEALFASYLRDPQSVSPDWQQQFQGFSRNGSAPFKPPATITAPRPGLFHADRNAPGASGVSIGGTALQERVDRLVHAYRVRGHIIARIDPLDQPRPSPPELTLEYHGLSPEDLERPVSGSRDAKVLRQVIQRMRNTYCRSIGVQFMHIDEIPVRKWLQLRMEATENRLKLRRDEQLRILTRLTDAVTFEEFLQKKYIGAKSFSLEGAETLIPLLDLIIEKSGNEGAEEIVLAMAHRGRLNVLANILKKPPRAIFREFEDSDAGPPPEHDDVKYHLGHSSDWQTASGQSVHLSLCFNPSHLEFVNPVAVGRMRAKQDRFGDIERKRGVVLLIHGDAAFAGQGISQETLNLSQLPAYKVGGAVHLIVNNQVGFTTPPSEARSSLYATDVAKMLQIPIFHVNGEDPEAVAQVVQLALDFRNEFQRDVVIDMYCYRRRGHNEGDEPSFTQPLMYQAISQRDGVRESYLERLLLLGEITVDEAERMAGECRSRLEKELKLARSPEYAPNLISPAGLWAGYEGGEESNQEDVETGIERDQIAQILDALTRLPADLHLNPKIERNLEHRREMAKGARPIDWSAAEAIALGSLAISGVRVRMTGQDVPRGTFSHRHAVLHDVRDGHTWCPLANLQPDQAAVEIANSPLSEAAVVGFEYGYSLDCPDGLVLWEAQFGDFNNGAQVIIDQFIASAEEKWHRLSGLVLLLPHGYEGQGPEHSSARIERFLNLAAADNLQVIVPSTPAQYFHSLRRQVLRRWRKPLVVMTPKSLLRNPQAVSSLEDLTAGQFQRVIPDDRKIAAGKVRRILLCCGKLYYDLAKYRHENGRTDVALLRLEQLYPLPQKVLQKVLAQYTKNTPVIWVQEEPENMGAWQFLRYHLGDRLFNQFPFSGFTRPAAASPATGSHRTHDIEQHQLIDAAFNAR